MLVAKDSDFAEKVSTMSTTSTLRANAVAGLAACHSNTLLAAIINRVHSSHYEKCSIFDAARDVRFPNIHRSLTSKAEGYHERTAVGIHLEPLCARNEMGILYEPKESNQCIQLNLSGPIKFFKESDNYIFIAEDRF